MTDAHAFAKCPLAWGLHALGEPCRVLWLIFLFEGEMCGGYMYENHQRETKAVVKKTYYEVSSVPTHSRVHAIQDSPFRIT